MTRGNRDAVVFSTAKKYIQQPDCTGLVCQVAVLVTVSPLVALTLVSDTKESNLAITDVSISISNSSAEHEWTQRCVHQT